MSQARMSQILVPAQRPVPAQLPYTGRHRLPEPANPPARDLAELEGTTRDLHGPAGAAVSANAVWMVGRP